MGRNKERKKNGGRFLFTWVRFGWRSISLYLKRIGCTSADFTRDTGQYLYIPRFTLVAAMIEEIRGERSEVILKKLENENDQEDKNKAKHQIKISKNGEQSTMQNWDISFGEEENETKYDVNSTHMHSPLFERGLSIQGMDPTRPVLGVKLPQKSRDENKLVVL